MAEHPEARYLWGLIQAHVRRFFSKEAFSILQSAPVEFLPWAEIRPRKRPALLIPVDISCSIIPKAPYKVAFGSTELTLWNRLPKPEDPGWEAYPSDEQPLWYRHLKGTLMPAWNFFGNLFSLLSSHEERESLIRDEHGRFTGAMSPRDTAGLLEVPAFNEAVAALVSAAVGLLANNVPRMDSAGLLRPPVVVLSHDVDILRGNDIWTQGARCYRFIKPVFSAHLPRLSNVWWIIRNAFRPEDFFLDNIEGMVEVERMLGFRSTFYFLNGHGGRFGARNGSAPIPDALRMIPEGWEIGMHYNYNTFLDTSCFEAQRKELMDILGVHIDQGRAHYMRMDTEHSFPFLERMGIMYDETGGFPDRVGYRFGIAGPFEPFDPKRKRSAKITEMPLIVMDGTLISQYPDNPVDAFRRLLFNLSHVGGAISLLFHPGNFFNPEHPETQCIYRKLLGVMRDLDAVGTTLKTFIEQNSFEI